MCFAGAAIDFGFRRRFKFRFELHFEPRSEVRIGACSGGVIAGSKNAPSETSSRKRPVGHLPL